MNELLFGDRDVGEVVTHDGVDYLIMANEIGDCPDEKVCAAGKLSKNGLCPFACTPENRQDHKYVYYIKT